MRAGEYVGADGERYAYRQVFKAPERLTHTCIARGDMGCYVSTVNARPAAAALLALADELETEYVELTSATTSSRYRIVLKAGAEPHLELAYDGDWREAAGDFVLAAFRAGQERGQR